MARTLRPGTTAVQPWRQRLLPASQSWIPASSLSLEASKDEPALPPADLIAAARAEAGDLLEHAQSEARKVIDQAHVDCDQLRTTAYQEGFSSGRETGQEDVGLERRLLRDLTEQIAAAYQSFCLEQTPHLAALATEVAEKLLHEQLSLEPERVVTVVRRALEHAHDSRQVILYLHPEDLELVRAALPAETPSGTEHSSPELILRPDPTHARGGCRIATEHGEVDACPVGAIARLKEEVTADLPDESEP